MKKYNIVFLFILLLFLGLSKNINISTKDNSSTTSNVASDVSNENDDAHYVDPNLILTLSDNVDSYGGYQITSYKYTGSNTQSLIIPSEYEGKKITSIGSSAFGQSPFKYITIEYGIKELRTNCFIESPNLIYCVIPNSVLLIANGVFARSPKMTQLFIPQSVNNIGNLAFSDCTALQNVYMAINSNSIVANDIFACSTTGVFTNTKFYCRQGTLSVLNPTVSGVGKSFTAILVGSDDDYLFDGTSNTILRYIGSGRSTNISIPSTLGGYSMKNINQFTFAFTKNIKQISFEEGIVKVNDATNEESGAFYGCVFVESISLPTSLTYIGDFGFYGLQSLKTISSQFLTGIGTACFFQCYNLTKVNFPNLVSQTGKFAEFGSCQSLEDVNLPKLTIISNRMFENCKKLTNINIESATTFIGTVFYNCNSLEYIYINSGQNITSISSTAFNDMSNFKYFLCDGKDTYNKNISAFKSAGYEKLITYKVEIKYMNTGLFNNPTFTSEFQSKIDGHKNNDSPTNINIYTYYAGDEIQIPTENDFMYSNGQTLALYTDINYTNSIDINSGTSSPSQFILNKTLNAGTVDSVLVIYCNLYTDPISIDNQAKYEVASFDSNNNPVSNIFTINNINKELNLRFTNDANTGVTGLPVVGYTYTYTWYVKESNSSTYTLISNNNDKEPSTLTLIPLSGKDLNCVYRCTIQIKNTSGTSIIFSKDITLTYEKEDITVVVNDQTVSNTSAISSVYGTNYTASINGVVLSEDEMNLYFGSNYGLVSKSNNGNLEISFFGSLQEPYSSNYNVNTLQTRILTTKTNSTNLILISVTSGLFVVEVIVFMVVIFKQRSRG